ncbi:MAG: OmpA family protein [Cyclobacteriaceae bacterium]
MKNIILCSIVLFALVFQDALGQCNNIIPPSVKKIQYATREVTFTNVKMNGQTTTYLAVRPGESVDINLNVESRKNGDYCPACIVQIYWGIRGHASVCANSFYGYKFNRKKSSIRFKAPMKDGIYYVTMGATLDYSCKNNKMRPECSEDKAFAVIKVGNPDPEKRITLTNVQKGAGQFLNTTLVKSGCYGELYKTEWFLDGEKLAFDNQRQIPLAKYGNYKVVWSNCLTSTSMNYNHSQNNLEVAITEPKKTPQTYTNNVKTYNRRSDISDNNETEIKTLDLSKTSDQSSNTETLTIQSPPPSNQKRINEPISFTRISKSDPPVSNTEFEIENVNTVDTDTIPLVENEIAELIEKSDHFVLEHLIFDLGKADLLPEAEDELDKIAVVMNAQPSMRILLEGHTDRRGSARKNQVLSEKRVESAKKYLVKSGISKSRIETVGYGHFKPLVVTSDVEEGKVNRRVEIEILQR